MHNVGGMLSVNGALDQNQIQILEFYLQEAQRGATYSVPKFYLKQGATYSGPKFYLG